ncbi:hypothetical protein O0L34_g13897 [Tuta absoluta]|nr:hypothetical protein O0L34_g13897 [Tuta absoluta]
MDPTPPKPPDPPDPEVFVSPLSPINDEIRPGSPPSDNTFNNLYYLGTQSEESSNLQFQALIHQEPMDYTVENNRKRSNKEIDAGLVSSNKKVAVIAIQEQSSQNIQNPRVSQPTQVSDSSQSPQSNNTQSQSNQNHQNSTRQFYKESDTGPFIVHVVKEGESDQQVHPIMFGKLIFSLKIKNIKMGGIKKIGRNRLSIEFENPFGANEFLKNDTLGKSKYRCFIPSYNVTRLGVVKGLPIEFTEEDIIENITLPYGYSGKIIRARRLKYRKMDEATRTVSRLDSETVVLTFDALCIIRYQSISTNSL